MEQFFIGPREPMFFMHIPKTAGTSMRRFLADQYPRDQVCPANGWYHLTPLADELDKFALIQGHFHVGLKGALGRRKSVTLLRNPLNRTLSALRHLQRDPNFHPLHARAKEMTVEQLLSDPGIFAMHRNGQTGYLSSNTDTKAIFEFMRAGSQEDTRREPTPLNSPPDLAKAKENLEQFDFVGTCDDLDSFFPAFCEAMGYHPVSNFQNDNNAPDGLSDYSKLSAKEMDLLVACNDLDLQLYSHAKRIAADQAKKVSQSGWNIQSAISKLCEREIYRRPQGSFTIDIAGALPGLGWYEPETTTNGSQRWTGPYRQFGLDIPLPAEGHYRATVKFYSTRDIAPGAFTVKAQDLLLPVQLTQNDKSYTAIFDIPQFHLAAKNGIAQLIFEIPSVFRPADTGLPDRRTLGVIVSSVSFKRLL